MSEHVISDIRTTTREHLDQVFGQPKARGARTKKLVIVTAAAFVTGCVCGFYLCTALAPKPVPEQGLDWVIQTLTEKSGMPRTAVENQVRMHLKLD